MSVEPQIKIAIADDHKIFRDGIKMPLSGKKDLKMLWEAEDGKDMMHKIAIKKPEVLLMDIRMPVMDGLQATRTIKARWPRIKVIILSMYGDYEAQALAAGADAFVNKGEPPTRLLQALDSVIGA